MQDSICIGFESNGKAASKTYLNLVKSPRSPLSHRMMAHCFKNSFMGLLRSSLTRAGFDVSKFSGHSFHRAVAFLGCGIPRPWQWLQRLWNPTAGKIGAATLTSYISIISQARLLSLSSCLHWAITHSQPFEPLSHLLPSIWLEHSPTRHTKERRQQQYYYCSTIHRSKA